MRVHSPVDVLIFLNLYLHVYLGTEVLFAIHGVIFVDIRNVCYWRTIFRIIKEILSFGSTTICIITDLAHLMGQSEINNMENKHKSNLFVASFTIFSLSSPRSLFRRLFSAVVISKNRNYYMLTKAT